MANIKKKVVLIIPSGIIAKGVAAILEESNSLRVETVLKDLSKGNDIILKNAEADLIILDPAALDYASRINCRATVSEYSNACLIALPSIPMDEEMSKQYDEVLSLFDNPSVFLKKVLSVIPSSNENKTGSLNELSSREKEILVCVAKGMLNKEIAYELNLSIYTVITHRKNITRKTGIKTVAGLTVYALLNNLIDPMSLE